MGLQAGKQEGPWHELRLDSRACPDLTGSRKQLYHGPKYNGEW